MLTRVWFAAALTRALRTFAQAAVALIGTAVVIEGVDWRVVVSGSVLSAVLSVLQSLGGLPEVPPQDATLTAAQRRSLTNAEREADRLDAANRRAI